MRELGKKIVDMRGYWLIVMIVIAGLCLEYATAKEPTTLDEAVDRPVKIEQYVDKENGVVCYWHTRHPAYLTCVYVPAPGLTWRNKRIGD